MTPAPSDRAHPQGQRLVRPGRLVLVVGTGTDVGKTWVSARILSALRAAGLTVAARKLAQSYAADDPPEGYDSAVLAAASGEPELAVCPPHRWFDVAMAPPMAAEALGRPGFSLGDLEEELVWAASGIGVGADAGATLGAVPAVGLVESAGGVCSPQADDGDAVALCRDLAPNLVMLVADAGLGTINAVRLSVVALVTGLVVLPPLLVVLNRFDPADDLHVRNRQWLAERDGLAVVVTPGDEEVLAALVRGVGGPADAAPEGVGGPADAAAEGPPGGR